MRLWKGMTLAIASLMLAITGAPVRAQGNEPAPPPVPVVVTLTTERVYYRPGEPVVVTLALRNTGAVPVTLGFGTSQRFDLFVRHVPTGQLVWQWSFNKLFLPVLGAETLLPGETRVVKEEWKQLSNGNSHVPTGIYKLEAVVTSVDPAALPSNPTFIQIGRRLF